MMIATGDDKGFKLTSTPQFGVKQLRLMYKDKNIKGNSVIWNSVDTPDYEGKVIKFTEALIEEIKNEDL